MPRFVAFLRAINTPPRHVKMLRLRDVFSALGFTNVATFIASGNVVFDTGEESGLERRIETALEAELGFAVPAYVRTAAEVLAVADRPPFTTGEVEVSFLPATPEGAAARALEETAAGIDDLKVVGREVYWRRRGPADESGHREATVVRLLGMETTRRSLRTVQRLADTHLRGRG